MTLAEPTILVVVAAWVTVVHPGADVAAGFPDQHERMVSVVVRVRIRVLGGAEDQGVVEHVAARLGEAAELVCETGERGHDELDDLALVVLPLARAEVVCDVVVMRAADAELAVHELALVRRPLVGEEPRDVAGERCR